MNTYKINLSRLVVLMLPVSLRTSTFIAFLFSFVVSIQRLYVAFMNYRKDVAYRMNHNSQVCYLQAVLNDNFDFIQRRIYITDAEFEAWSKFLWKEEFDRPIMLGTYMLQSDRFIGVDGMDFIVHVPYALNLDRDEYARMHSLLRYYKLASKRYVLRNYF